MTKQDNVLNEILYKYIDSNNDVELQSTKNHIFPLEKVLLNVLKIIDQSNLKGSLNIDIKIAIEISIKSIQAELGKFNNLFSTVITVSPLLGLLGTVLGLINSFSFIKIGGSGINSQEVTGGISEALVSTAFGLTVAIFTLVFANYFNSLWREQNSILNQYCGKFEILYKKSN